MTRGQCFSTFAPCCEDLVMRMSNIVSLDFLGIRCMFFVYSSIVGSTGGVYLTRIEQAYHSFSDQYSSPSTHVRVRNLSQHKISAEFPSPRIFETNGKVRSFFVDVRACREDIASSDKRWRYFAKIEDLKRRLLD